MPPRWLFEDGHHTGKILSPLNVGKGKALRLGRFLKGRGRHIDLHASYSCTGAIIDAPALEVPGHPVAVFPDRDLANLAAARGWLVTGPVSR